MASHYDALLERLADVQNIGGALALLSWDQETQMPPGGAAARARQIATLARMSHEIFTADETGDLLQKAAAEVDTSDFDSEQASVIRVVQQDYDQQTKLPADFVAKYSQHVSLSQNIWAEARAKKDFSHFRDALAKMIDFVLQEAEYRGYDEHPYDALLGNYERGMTTAEVDAIFSAHRPALVELISQISDAQQVDNSFLHQHFPQDKQRDFAMRMIQKYGFDMQRGVQAISTHPFCTSFSINDVRITTRFDENWLNPALFGMMHEAGHGMYEQGIAQHLENNPLGNASSLAVHESQSRMWENIVGRSKGFWSWALPQLKETFPQLSAVSLDDFYKGINKVAPSFIRVEADEATYNLHIMLRFQIEKDVLTGALKVDDLPQVWNDTVTEYLGITPQNDAEGVLQDVHWSAGLMGYFPTYALGNLLSVQYYNKAVADKPAIPDEIANGEFDTLRTWLNENIHAHGRKYTGQELTKRVTGESIQSDDYMTYLQTKFGAIYGL